MSSHENNSSHNEMFHGSNIEKINIEQDTDWLELVTSSEVVVDEAYIEKLNDLVEMTLGGEALKNAMEKAWEDYYNHPSRTRGLGHLRPREAQLLKHAKERFYFLLGKKSSESPLNEANRIENVAVINFVQNMRFFHRYLGDDLPLVFSKSASVIAISNASLERKAKLLEDNEISIAAVIRGNSSLLVHKDKEPYRGKFINDARAVGVSTRSLAIKKLRKLQRDVFVSEGAAERYRSEITEPYLSLSGLTHLAPELLVTGLPQVARFNAQQVTQLHKLIETELEDKDELKLRELSKLVLMIVT